MKKTKVIFLIDMPEVSPSVNENVFAYFPDEDWGRAKEDRMSYAHIGQHSGCGKKYAESCKIATPEQYKDLAAELESIGYNLQILTNL